MVFADIKNDFVFRRIFGNHPDLLRALLNDLLERTGDSVIDSLEYLPSEQLPMVEGAKLSVLDVRCKDKSGTTFVVEMQLLHHPGFVNRVVFNACKAYVGQLRAGERFSQLMDVIAISICDFELWPDAKQIQHGLPLVPMLSRWNMTEKNSKSPGILQVQYAFLELPKLRGPRPDAPGANLWAWLFAHARELNEIPAELKPGPYGDALELATQAQFTASEREVYERTWVEIQQVFWIREEGKIEGEATGLVKGLAKGKIEGKAEGLADAILTILDKRKVLVPPEARAQIRGESDIGRLEQWLDAALTLTTLDVLGLG